MHYWAELVVLKALHLSIPGFLGILLYQESVPEIFLHLAGRGANTVGNSSSLYIYTLNLQDEKPAHIPRDICATKHRDSKAEIFTRLFQRHKQAFSDLKLLALCSRFSPSASFCTRPLPLFFHYTSNSPSASHPLALKPNFLWIQYELGAMILFSRVTLVSNNKLLRV